MLNTYNTNKTDISNLFTIFVPLFTGFFPNLLLALSFLAIITAILVITTKNPVYSVLFLIMLFFFIACYLAGTGYVFIGLAYLLIYVGAVSILFLFILMLINIRVSELISETWNSIPLVLMICVAFINAKAIYLAIIPIIEDIKICSQNIWEGNIIESSHASSLGNVMYTNYAILLILVSIILLLAMVGAIVITIKQKNVDYEINNTNILILKSQISSIFMDFLYLYNVTGGVFNNPDHFDTDKAYIMWEYKKAFDLLTNAKVVLVDNHSDDYLFMLQESKRLTCLAYEFCAQGDTRIYEVMSHSPNPGQTSITENEIIRKAFEAAKANHALDMRGKIMQHLQEINKVRELWKL